MRSHEDQLHKLAQAGFDERGVEQRGDPRNQLAVVVKTVLGSHFGAFGEFTTHFRTYFSGDRDVHWGYGILTRSQSAVDCKSSKHLKSWVCRRLK